MLGIVLRGTPRKLVGGVWPASQNPYLFYCMTKICNFPYLLIYEPDRKFETLLFNDCYSWHSSTKQILCRAFVSTDEKVASSKKTYTHLRLRGLLTGCVGAGPHNSVKPAQ